MNKIQFLKKLNLTLKFNIINYIQVFLKFLTTWSNILFILVIIFNKFFSDEYKYYIICLMMTAGILGTFLINKYNKNIPNEIYFFIKVIDIFTHILPVIYIIYFMDIPKINKYKYINKIYILLLILSQFYIKLINPSEKVYFFIKYTNKELYTIFTFIYLIIYINLN